MWIRTQDKQQIINEAHIIDIFIGNGGKTIYAETTRDGDFFILGNYKNRDECMDILTTIHIAISAGVPIIEMPLGGDIKSWKSIVKDLTNKYALIKVIKKGD